MTWYKANAPESEVPMIPPNEKLPEWAREAEQPAKKRGGMMARITQLGPIVAKNSKFDKKKGKLGNERKAGETDGGFDHTTCEEAEVQPLAQFHPGDMLFSVNTSK